ncbi:MAG TPA: Type 1 glutamine amidotransferase-like domain-containing protein, partial [Candidatus Limnocylindrales bacterium]|nr:Type 1 glutamine amidotransferase-like domain-containing protein [Candidatus Limnocylindrales bacterium]
MPIPVRRPTTRRAPLRVAAVAVLVIGLLGPAAATSGSTIATFVPIGAGYATDTLEQFAAEAAEVDTSGNVSILVLPITYGIDPLAMGPGERKKNLTLADGRRSQVHDACLAVIPAGETCETVLAPVLVRDDAFDPANVALVTPGLDGIYILGGDQVVAMQVVANTPFEEALASAQAAGAVTSGNSAGAAVQSTDMIAGYVGNNGPEQGFEQGAVDLWTYDGPTDETRGLVFGLNDVLLDQHVLQRGRIARLISTSYAAGELGIGLDADTAATIEAGTNLTEVGGLSAAFVADSLTYSALGQFDGSGTLSIHGVATHVLPPGDAYDLAARQPIVGGSPVAAPDLAGRTFPAVATPAGSGRLILGGGRPSSAVLDRLVAASGGPGSGIVVLAVGYAKSADAAKDAKAISATAATSGASASWFVVDANAKTAQLLAAIAGADGIVLTAPDPSTVLASLAAAGPIRDAVEDAWRGGAALLANDAAASAIGRSFTSDPRPGTSIGSIEAAAIAEFRPDSTTVVAGLGWVDAAVEPGIVSNRHWGRAYNLLAAQDTADRLVFGIDAGTAIEFDA